MTDIPLWAVPIYYTVELWSKCTPHRCAILGKTRVQYSWSKLADTIGDTNDTTPIFGTGVVVDYEFEYTQGPNRYLHIDSREAGKYLHNGKFPRGFIVQPDDGSPRRVIPEGSIQFLSGTSWAIPVFHSRNISAQRIGDLPAPLVAESDGAVRLRTDADGVVRKVRRIFFTSIGTPEYEILMTTDEAAVERAKTEREGDHAYPDRLMNQGNPTLGYYREEDLIPL